LFLETHGVKLGFMSAFVKAAADALLKVQGTAQPPLNVVAAGACCVGHQQACMHITTADRVLVAGWHCLLVVCL
jgi:hypothetical protein